MAPHSSTLAWKIPWTEEPGGLQSMGSLRFGHDWATSLPLFTFIHWRRKWQRTPVFLPGESQGRGGAWWAAVYGVAQSQTRLKQLSSSSSTAWILMNQSRYSNQSEKMSFVNNQHRIYRNQLRFNSMPRFLLLNKLELSPEMVALSLNENSHLLIQVSFLII